MNIEDIKHNKDFRSGSTLDFYDRNAEMYFQNTINLDMKFLYKQFLENVPKGGRALDAGSGSGRDTLAFMKQGFHIDAFDASIKLASMSTIHTGIKTKVMTFLDVCEIECYNGIGAVCRRMNSDSMISSTVLTVTGFSESNR